MCITGIQVVPQAFEQESWPRTASVALDESRHDVHALLLAEVEQLRRAKSSRAVIDQATGMLMAAYGLSEDRAVAVLAHWSQHQDLLLRTLAAAMVADAAHGDLALDVPHEVTPRAGSAPVRDPRAGLR